MCWCTNLESMDVYSWVWRTSRKRVQSFHAYGGYFSQPNKFRSNNLGACAEQNTDEGGQEPK